LISEGEKAGKALEMQSLLKELRALLLHLGNIGKVRQQNFFFLLISSIPINHSVIHSEIRL
jgi:hypothetical protein